MNKRQTQILELLTQYHKMEVAELSKRLEVSQVTIRKDLVTLENSGMIHRLHGYAMLNNSDDMNQRLAFHYDLKHKIAKKAIESIVDGETVMIESGSCCALVALEIAKTKKSITLITNSAFIADYIRKEKTVKVILLGGEYQNESQVMVGPMTRQCVQNFLVDKFFIGTDGYFLAKGFTGNDYMRSETVRDMAKQAQHVIVVTESSKFHQIGTVHLLDNKEIFAVVTDHGIPAHIEEELKQEGIDVQKVDLD